MLNRYKELYFSSGSRCSAEQNRLDNFAKGSQKKNMCEINLNLDQRFRRCCLKIFLIYSSVDHIVLRSKTIATLMVESTMRYIYVKLFWVWTSGSGGDVV